VDATWGATEVMGAARGIAKVVGIMWGMVEDGEAGDARAMRGRAVRPPGVAVGPPTFVPWVI
jgi:hypothetical protein